MLTTAGVTRSSTGARVGSSPATPGTACPIVAHGSPAKARMAHNVMMGGRRAMRFLNMSDLRLASLLAPLFRLRLDGECKKMARRVPGHVAKSCCRKRSVCRGPQADRSEHGDDEAGDHMHPHRGWEGREAQCTRRDYGPKAERHVGPFLDLMECVERSDRDQRHGSTDDPGIPCGIGFSRIAEIPGREQKTGTGNDVDDIESRPLIGRQRLQHRSFLRVGLLASSMNGLSRTGGGCGGASATAIAKPGSRIGR